MGGTRRMKIWMAYVVILWLKMADFLNWQDTNSYIIHKIFLIPSEIQLLLLLLLAVALGELLQVLQTFQWHFSLHLQNAWYRILLIGIRKSGKLPPYAALLIVGTHIMHSNFTTLLNLYMYTRLAEHSELTMFNFLFFPPSVHSPALGS